MDNYLISVIIPAYNAGEYFNHCIKSIVNQTYKNLEIIIIDDGSTDNTPNLCDEWASKDNRIKVIHKENEGASSARNVGLDLSAGDYITFVDADDYLDLDMYEIMLNEIIYYNSDAARCGVVREYQNGKKEDWGTGNTDIKTVNNRELLIDVAEAIGILPVSPCNKLYSKKCIGNIRFDTRFKNAEDTLFNFEVSKNIETIVYHDVSRYHYICNPYSTSQRKFDNRMFDEQKVMDVMFKIADADILPHCIKGDIMKTFRTIKVMLVAGGFEDKYKEMRYRIISHRKDVFYSGIYSNPAKIKTLLIWLMPNIYKVLIKKYEEKNMRKNALQIKEKGGKS